MTSKLIIISGRSGCGKSIALNALEDLGFYCVDNLPLDLLLNLITRLSPKNPNIAISIDSRNMPKDTTQLNQIINNIEQLDIKTTVIYLYADKSVILNRYSETRRRHPLTNQQTSLEQAIELETQLISPLAALSSISINTNTLTNHQLHTKIRRCVTDSPAQHLQLQIHSFGFKFGVPTDTDFLFDVRCLPNPFWIPELKPLTGYDQEVIDYLSNQPDVINMLNDISNYLSHWIPKFIENNRSYLTVSIGCTGGKHRSVFIANQLVKKLAGLSQTVHLKHREMALQN